MWQCYALGTAQAWLPSPASGTESPERLSFQLARVFGFLLEDWADFMRLVMIVGQQFTCASGIIASIRMMGGASYRSCECWRLMTLAFKPVCELRQLQGVCASSQLGLGPQLSMSPWFHAGRVKTLLINIMSVAQFSQDTML